MLAILMVAAATNINLLGITTVAGNSYVENTYRNTMAVSKIAGLNIPLIKGMSKPLIREQVVAHYFHGESGLDHVELPEVSLQNRGSALEFMAKTLTSAKDKITILATGPLTNVAAFLLLHPDLKEKIDSIVFMGGGLAFGNITPTAEFNIYADPEAAAIVLSSEVPLVMIPLDLTHQAIFTPIEHDKLPTSGAVSAMVRQCLSYVIERERSLYGWNGTMLHDPCAAAYVIDSKVMRCEEYRAWIELRGEHTYGQTVVDLWRSSGEKPNVKIGKTLDKEAFFDLLFSLINSYEQIAPKTTGLASSREDRQQEVADG